MPEGVAPSQMQGGFGGQIPNMGELPEGFDPSQMPNGFGGQMPSMGEMPEGFESMFPGQSSGGRNPVPSENSGNSDNSPSSGKDNRPSGGNMPMPGGDFNFNADGINSAPSTVTNWILLGVSVLILGAGLLIAKLYKR